MPSTTDAGNPSNTTNTDKSSSSSQVVDQNTTMADILMVPKMPDNPFYAFINFKVGKYDFTTLPPEHVQNMTYTRVTQSGGNTLSIDLFDETAIKVEFQIAQGNHKAKFQYGYTNGEFSPVINITLTKIDINFNPSGAVLHLEGVSGAAVNSKANPKSCTYKNMTISDIVRTISNEEGWGEGTIIDTKPVPGDDGSENRSFTRTKQPATIFITKDLIPFAKSNDTGDGDYELNFDDTTGAVNFRPKYHGPTIEKKSKRHSYEFAWGSGDKNSRVIDFNPEYSGTVIMLNGGAQVEATTFDAVKNQMYTVNYDKNTDKNRTLLADKSNVDQTSAKTPIGLSACNPEDMKSIAAMMWLTQAGQFVKANLSILGDVNINPYDLVSMVVLNKDGYAHHTSGAYMITKVVDSISNGSFVTQIEMQRNAMKIGLDKAGNIVVGIVVDMSTVNGSKGSPLTGDGNGDIVNIALGEVGTSEEPPGSNHVKYNDWYGQKDDAWCAVFVSWCANKAGISTDIVPKTAAVEEYYNFFTNNNRWIEAGSGTPSPGDLVIFGSDHHHVGLVVKYDNGSVVTVEGNTSSDNVAKNTYSDESSICGYGHPNYTAKSSVKTT